MVQKPYVVTSTYNYPNEAWIVQRRDRQRNDPHRMRFNDLHPSSQRLHRGGLVNTRAKELIHNAIEEHQHIGNGICSCGVGIGYSDGTGYTVLIEEHQAVVATRLLTDGGLLAGGETA